MKLTQLHLRALILEQLSQMVSPEGGGGIDPYINIDAYDKNKDGVLSAEEERARTDVINKNRVKKDKWREESTDDGPGRKEVLQALEIVSIIDPTGISGWPLLNAAMEEHEANPTTKNKYKVYMAAVGVIPLIGKGKILIKIISAIRRMGKPGKGALEAIKKIATEIPEQSGKISDLLKASDIQAILKSKDMIKTLTNNRINPDRLVKILNDLIKMDQKIDIHKTFRKALFYLGNAIDYAIDKAIDTATFDNMADFAKYVGNKGYKALSALVKEEKKVLVNKKIIEQFIKESIGDRFNPNQNNLHSASVGGIPIKIQIVDDEAGRKKGLMYRQNMPKDEGMLFIHDVPDMCGYYMKNTYIPLSIAYADDEGTIFQIEDMNPGDLTSVMSIQPALYALEMNQGWFDDNEIVIGNIIEF